MPAFEYIALDPSGRERKGVAEGDTARQVRQQLREQGLTPLEVQTVAREARRERDGAPRVSRGRRLKAAELALVTRQLATLVRSNLPLEEALRTVAEQADQPRIKSMMLAVRSRVVEGHTLSAGLAEFPRAFSELYRATVDAGEQAGHLDMVLERLADYTEARQQFQNKTQLALLYPVILTAVAILVVMALLTYVVPQVVQVFQDTHQQLPWLTRALIAVSGFLREWGLLILILLAAAAFVGGRLLRNPALRLRAHRLVHRLPLAGRLFKGSNAARFARTFSILAASGVPILDALRISAEVLGSLPMRAAVTAAAAKVREGASVHRALAPGGHFPPMLLQLIASGESGGNLEEMLERAALSQEREQQATVETLMALFEPILILVMGGVVLTIVLAILLPIFDLNTLVK